MPLLAIWLGRCGPVDTDRLLKSSFDGNSYASLMRSELEFQSSRSHVGPNVPRRVRIESARNWNRCRPGSDSHVKEIRADNKMLDRRAVELVLISLLAAFCGGLAWALDHELFAVAFAAAAVTGAFGVVATLMGRLFSTSGSILLPPIPIRRRYRSRRFGIMLLCTFFRAYATRANGK